MQKLKFIFGIHCHQPVGNFEHVFEEAHKKAYLPFIKVLESHPKVKFTAHYSGVLYDWFEKKHPGFIKLLQKLAKRGQVEILSGGYYEPVLSIIPDQDKLGQIETASQFIREKFGMAPQGMWLTERIWEPTLPKILSQAGIEYTIVDDHHFHLAGLSDQQLRGYYITEEEGQKLSVFPINKKLRDLIPFRPPEEIIEYLRSVENKDNNAAIVFIDDGEKFGLRDGGHKYIYREGYLEKLISQLEANADWIEFTTFSNYLEEYPARGRIYLPAASYAEMMEWSGGFFRNFFIKYPEANNMHKKMLHVSNRLHTLRKGKVLIGEEEKDKRLKEAIKYLYKAQCNCAYWHGLFGGLYFNFLREAVYANLIRAENELEKFNRGSKPYVELIVTDFNKDGSDEVILSNNLLNLYFAPAQGGALFELDYKAKAVNLVNSLSRGYQRLALLDHFLTPDCTLQRFNAHDQKESGSYSFMPKRKQSEVSLLLSKEGMVEGIPVKIEKTISLLAKQSIFNVEYRITNQGKEPDEFWFGVESNFSLADKSLGAQGEIPHTRELKLIDEGSNFNVSLEMSKAALLWHFPIETEFQSEGEPKKIYQSLLVFPSWKFKLKPSQSWTVKLTVRIEN